MLGWWIIVTNQTPEERNGINPGSKSFILAQWETGLGGKDWIKHLIDLGQMTTVHLGAYPDRYTGRATDIIPLIAHGPAPHTLSPAVAEHSRRIEKLSIEADRIAACPPDQMLTVETWDLS